MEAEATANHGGIPSWTCGCGLYAYKTEADCRSAFGPGIYGHVVARVKMGGRVILDHRPDLAYRSEYARVDALIGDKAELRGLSARYNVPIVEPIPSMEAFVSEEGEVGV